MIWTSSPPSTPGWYWWRFNRNRKMTILNISQSHLNRDDVFTMETTNIGTIVLFIQELPGQWAGPIAPPEETGG